MLPDTPVARMAAALLALAAVVPGGLAVADGETILLDESFEAAFPQPPWRVEHPAGAAPVDWGRSSFRATDGSWGLYCAAVGSAAPGDGGPAPARTTSWAVAGPFDLSDTTSGTLRFDLWLRTERFRDVFMWLVSTDGVTFNGSARSTDTAGWQTVTADLANWGAAGNVLGSDEVWVAFVYQSDQSNLFEGAYLDRVQLAVDTGSPADQAVTYTTDADFALGTAIGLDGAADRLELADGWGALPFVWVPNSGSGTVSKLSAETGDELGRYATGADELVDPGVAAVDLEGAAWVGNRGAGTVVKVGLHENGGCADRDGDGVITTSRDRNGNGIIAGSELLDWGDDECVLFEVVLVKGREGVHVPGDGHDDVAANGLQAVAVDRAGDVWAGVAGSRMLYRLDGATGQILASLDLAGEAASPSSLAVTPDGKVWASSWPDAFLLGVDPSTLETTRVTLDHRGRKLTVAGANVLYVTGYEDQALSRVNPTTGETAWIQYAGWLANGVATTSDGGIWVASPGDISVSRFNPQGFFLGSLLLNGAPTGLAVDQDGKIWALSSASESVFRIDPALFRTDLEKVVTGAGTHEATGDLTGIVARNVTSKLGSWTVVQDSGTSATPWGLVTWQGSEPESTEVAVRVRSSDDGGDWSVWEEAVSGRDLAATPPGRYLEVQATLHRQTGSGEPTLDEITVAPAVVQPLPVASFTVSPAEPAAGDTVALTDTTTGEPTSWSWDFGDGGTSTDQSPVHAFDAAGSYQVSLTASNDQGSDTATATVTVVPAAGCALTCSATVPMTAGIGETVGFQSQVSAVGCAGAPTFSWSFGDGAGSAEPSPDHIYGATGTLRWQLTVTVDGETCRDAGDITISSAGPAACERTWWVPVASRADGLFGSVWRTDLGLLGVDGGTVAVEVRLHADDGIVSRVVSVAPAAMVNLVDVVDWIDPGRTGSGALEVCADGVLVVTSRTYNQLAPDHAWAPGGTFGQFLAGEAEDDGLAAGDRAFLGQLRESDAFRTNLGFVNTGDEPARVEVRLRDGTGAELAAYQLDLQPRRWLQDPRPLERRAGRSDLEAASARVTVTSGSGVLVLASVIDNLTNDATTVPMVVVGP
ncbi:MAG TPA: PKD domain-containing protein [Candidatus Sulfomarinibacteraceae bacterium]|nr:PKD domain-containing protein [Candidatus Sulfomarinibacteraceae bacterium]